MPPDGAQLPPAEVALLTRWISEGAAWPDGLDAAPPTDRRKHWSFQPLKHAVPPAVRDVWWVRNPIDRFVLARLEREGLQPSAEAERTAWLRRASFDLIGLPPTPEEVHAFVHDQSDAAFEAAVDRLLTSPHYGERWAQHWLDVVRYADTHGFEVNTERPHAWPYRDYVIRSLNRDTSYDRFVKEQIAGDALGEDAATGFLVTASVLLPGQIGADEPSKRLARQDALDEIVANVGQTFLGLSVGCARCHDHKFDPISQRDYYGMQALVAGVEYGDRQRRGPGADANRAEEARLRECIRDIERRLALLTPIARPRSKPIPIRPAVVARINTDRFAPVKAKRVRFTVRATNDLEPCLDEVEIFDDAGANIALHGPGVVVSSKGDTVVADRHELRFVNDGVYGNARSWMSSAFGKGWVQFDFDRERTIDRVVWGRDREGQYTDRLTTSYQIEVAGADGRWQVVADSSDRAPYSTGGHPEDAASLGLSAADAAQAGRLWAEKRTLDARIAALIDARLVFAGTFRRPDDIRLLTRGDAEQPKDRVNPAFLSVFGGQKLAPVASDQDRRRALADWIADSRNPLTARVIVNRVWQGHFGAGLVDTPSDFGRGGSPASHPELLDWLAREFIRSGWSLKRMHRLIVLSATYRQSSQFNPAAAAKDADARLLWRYPPRRLDAEQLRDGMLAVAGRLRQTMEGRGFDLFDKRGGLTGFAPIESFAGEGLRRLVYAHKVRRERDGVFGAFDCPDAGQSAARRRTTTTTTQALNLFNSRFTIEQADAFARRVAEEIGGDVDHQVDRAYRLALGRPPDHDELNAAAAIVRTHGLATVCRALFNCNEAVFLP